MSHKKWFTGIASLALLFQVGFPTANYAVAKEKQMEPKVYLYQDSETVPTKEMSQWNFQAMKAQLAFNNGYTGKGVKIAIIDTGIAPHKDLKIAGGISTVDGVSSYVDTFGHGTHVAGIINAQINDIGMVGVAPDAEIYAVKAIEGGNSGKLSDIVEGIEWAIENKMDIISLSFGLQTDEPELRAVIQKAYQQGMIIVASSGNSGSDSSVGYPAKYPEVISVSAVDQSMNQGSFSSQGEEVDFTAPGVNVISTYLNNQYALISGTSQATPHIVGMLALLKEKYPTKSSRELENELQLLSQDLGQTGKDNVFGYGFVSYQNIADSGHSVINPTTTTKVTEDAVVEETFTTLQKMYITYAERYIGYIEKYKRTSYMNTAQLYINKLPNGKTKTELMEKLQEAVATITGEVTTTTEEKGTEPESNTKNGESDSSTTNPETNSSTEDQNSTTETKVEDVTLTASQLTYVKYAERYIGYVEKYNRTSYAKTAKSYIDRLPDCKKKVELQKLLEQTVASVTKS